jgi:hypothetical protein
MDEKIISWKSFQENISNSNTCQNIIMKRNMQEFFELNLGSMTMGV